MAIITKFPVPPLHGRQGVVVVDEIAATLAPAKAKVAKAAKALAPALAEVAKAAGATDKALAESAKAAKQTSRKNSMLGKVHIALSSLYKRLPEFDDDKYRFALEERWGVKSSAAMNLLQLDELLKWLAELGFQNSNPHFAKKNYSRMGKGPLIEKIDALLAEKGKQQGTFVSMDYAEGILKNQTKGKVTTVASATPRQLRAVIAALTNDAQRHGRRVK